jgi:CRISPR-associated endoribonuclease Cas6
MVLAFSSVHGKNPFIQGLVKGIMDQPDIAFGMKVTEVTIQQDPDLSNVDRFPVASPVFIKRTENNRERHYLYSDPEAGKLLTENHEAQNDESRTTR